jgi:hypothetical protein
VGIVPTFGNLSLTECSLLLQGVYLIDIAQLQAGIPPILAALLPGGIAGPGRRALRYIRADLPGGRRGERFRTIRDIWQYGGGDCDDLGPAVAAELTLKGIAAMPIVYMVRPGLAHCVVRTDDGQILDPSKLGGMGETPAGGLMDLRISGRW